jgi:hypothetical protein
MTRRLLLLLPLILLPAFAQGADVEDELILCGWDVVAILKMSDPPQKIWEWKADTCSTLPGLLRTRFATTDDCKPVDGGEKVLITSSGWGDRTRGTEERAGPVLGPGSQRAFGGPSAE